MAGQKTSFAIVVEFDLVAGSRDEFLRLVTENAQHSLAREPGCSRFDVLVPMLGSENGSVQILLYEIYEDRVAFDGHLQTPHFKAFDAATKAMVAGKTVRSFLVAGSTDG